MNPEIASLHQRISKGVGIVIFVAGMAAGWIINEQRKRQAMEGAQLDRRVRGYK